MAGKIKWCGDKILTFYTMLSCCSFIVVIFATAVQVVSRYVFNASVSWSEELARYAFVCATLLGAPLAVRKGADASMGVIQNALSDKGKKIQLMIVNGVIGLTAGVLIPYGISMALAVHGRPSAAMGIPMGLMYMFIPVSAIGVLTQAAVRIFELACPVGAEAASAKKEG